MRQACLTGQKGRMKSGKYLSRWTYSTGEVDIQERWAYRRGGHTGEVSIQKRWASKRNRPATELGIKKITFIRRQVGKTDSPRLSDPEKSKQY